jgi:hypothetical protein
MQISDYKDSKAAISLKCILLESGDRKLERKVDWVLHKANTTLHELDYATEKGVDIFFPLVYKDIKDFIRSYFGNKPVELKIKTHLTALVCKLYRKKLRELKGIIPYWKYKDEWLTLVEKGVTTKEIADKYQISHHKVRNLLNIKA